MLHSLEFRETAIRATDGRWFSVRIMPYRTQDNVIDGSVITFVDITVAKNLEARLREASLGGPGGREPERLRRPRSFGLQNAYRRGLQKTREAPAMIALGHFAARRIGHRFEV